MAKTGKKFCTRFWEIIYLDSNDVERRRLAQGPNHYRVAKVRKDLKSACPDMRILKIRRVSRPAWSVIFEETNED